MSVINTMLQDLDRRHGRSSGEAVPGDVVRSVKRESPWHLGRNALLLAFAIVVAGLAAAWWLQQRSGARAGAVGISSPPVPPTASTGPTKTPPAPAVTTVVATPPAVEATPAPQVVVAALPERASPSPKAVAARHPATAARADTDDRPDKSDSSSIRKTAPKFALAESMSPAAAATDSPPATTPTSLSSKQDKADAAPSRLKTAAAANAVVSKTYSAKQSSANMLAEAMALDQRGRQEEAKAPLQRILATNPRDVDARQMLVQMQLDTGHLDEARALLIDGQRLLPQESGFTLTLARLNVEAGDVGGAIEVLEGRQASARGDPQYHALLGALLLRVRRNEDAVQHYLVALRSDPANVSWLVGAGVAFEGVGNMADAVAAYRRAEGSGNLNPETARFLAERLARIAR